MAQPPAYSLSYSFTDYTANYPSNPLPGVRVDTEFRAVKATLDAILANLVKIQRDDGALKNGIVGPDALSDEFTVGIRSISDWTTATDFVANDATWYEAGFYLCLVGHTSGSFATDLAAGKWRLLTDIAPYAADAAAAAVTAEVLAGISLDVDLGPINTALAGKAALAGGNAFSGAQSFADPVAFSGLTTYGAKAAWTLGTATTALAYAEWKPSDYGAGKPGVFLKKSTTADTWEVELTDGAGGDTVLNIKATALQQNGNQLLNETDIDLAGINTRIRRARNMAFIS